MPWRTWTPTRLRRVARVLASSMNTVGVMTDAGPGYLKAMGNAQGEHALACELIGSSLAEWLGLATLDFALLHVGGDGAIVFLDSDESLPFAERRKAQQGPAFVTRGIAAETWNGTPEHLTTLVNPEAIPGLVLLDTWIGNPDRHPRRPPDTSFSTWRNPNLDNVMFEVLPKGKRRLIAMDYSVCLYCRDGGLRSRYDDRLVRDDGIYGLFPAFEPCVTEQQVQRLAVRMRATDALQQFMVEVLDRVPSEWQVDRSSRDAVSAFVSARAAYLADNFLDNLARVLPRQPG